MGGQKFQYDESGGTFFYFVLSFLALILIPSTYYWWPRKQKEDPDKEEQDCHCLGCQKKKIVLLSSDPWKGTKHLLTKCVIVLGWLMLIFLAYKVSQFDYEYANFDPYDILGVAPSASQGEIKKAYRRLSLILHPDKETGDEKAFMKLTKAYQALTDDEARKNWEKYGNPDGPTAMSFGIALPSWIVEKENSFWVLGLYALVFMVALPTVVGMWWYRSIRYSGDQVLLDTTQIYYYFFHKIPSMALKRVIMILGASLEFEKKYNSEIVERPTDNIEVPQLIKQLYNLGEKNKERPLCYYYSIKARALIHAHLSRIPLNPMTLDKDRMYIVKKCPYLIQEMVSCVSQLIILAYARRVPRLPTIETIENCMKLCPMIVQGLWEYKSPLLQLPHISEEHLKHFASKKRQVKSLQQLAQLKADDRRNLLRFLTDEQVYDVIKVLGKMPLIDFSVRSEVIDDEASNVYTAGAIVTVTCTLERREMSCLFGDDSAVDKHLVSAATGEDQPDNQDKEQTEKQENKEQTKKPVWMKKPSKKSVKKSSKKSSNKQKQQSNNNRQQQHAVAGANNSNSTSNHIKNKDSNHIKTSEKRNKNEDTDDEREDRDSSGSESDDEADKSDVETDNRLDKNSGGSEGEEDDDDWSKFQAGLGGKRAKALEGKSKQSHTVHSPYFPDVKQEYWWVYISDRKSRTLLTSPVLVTNLVQFEEVQLKFTAPRWPGLYTFTVCLRSDSYLGFDQSQDIKLDVKEAAEVPLEHPQWDISGEEDNGNKDGQPSDSVSEFTTDEDVDDSDCNS